MTIKSIKTSMWKESTSGLCKKWSIICDVKIGWIKKSIIILWDINIYVNTYVKTWLKTIKNCSPLCENYIPTVISNNISKKWTNTQEAIGQSTVPNTKRTISCKASNSLVEYHNRVSKHDIKGSNGNMFNAIFKENVQGQKHSRRFFVAESGLPSFRKPQYVGQNE